MSLEYLRLTPELIQTAEGITQLNNAITALNDLIPGDGETVRIYSGFGTPESKVSAGIGSVYLRKDGSTGTTIYKKESGTGDTGWVAIAQLDTPVSLANGGTGASLSDPDADKVFFWDDSESASDFLTLGTGLKTSATNLYAGLSNVIFAWCGYDGASGAGQANGIYYGNDQSPSGATDCNNLFYRRKWANSASYDSVGLEWKWTKIPSVSTLTVNARAWVEHTAITDAYVRLDIGSGTATGTSSNIISSTTPTWQTAFTVDVSGLSDGTTYDMVMQAGTTDSAGSIHAFLSAVTVEGS